MRCDLLPGQLWCCKNSGLGRMYIFQKVKDSVCHGNTHLHSIPVCICKLSASHSHRVQHRAVLSRETLKDTSCNAWSSWSTLYRFALNRTNAYCYTDSLMESTYFLSPHSLSRVPLLTNIAWTQTLTGYVAKMDQSMEFTTSAPHQGSNQPSTSSPSSLKFYFWYYKRWIRRLVKRIKLKLIGQSKTIDRGNELKKHRVKTLWSLVLP